MAVSFNCHCEERAKPVAERNWKVVNRKCNYSAFNGYHYTPSDWSLVSCHTCGALGRTKAKFVDSLEDGEIYTGKTKAKRSVASGPPSWGRS